MVKLFEQGKLPLENLVKTSVINYNERRRRLYKCQIFAGKQKSGYG